MLGYETANKKGGGGTAAMGRASLPDAGGLLYGGAVSLEAETYPTDPLTLVLRLKEYIRWGCSTSLTPISAWAYKTSFNPKIDTDMKTKMMIQMMAACFLMATSPTLFPATTHWRYAPFYGGRHASVR